MARALLLRGGQLSREGHRALLNCAAGSWSSARSARQELGAPGAWRSCAEPGARHSSASAPALAAAALAAPAAEGPAARLLRRRYAELLAAGTLRPDANQQALVGQLAALLDQLGAYGGAVAAHREQREAYQALYDQRLAELKAADDIEEQRQQEQQQQQQQQGGWLQRLLGSAGLAPADKPVPSVAQRARAAAAARHARVRQELGPGPQPPAAPQGLYVYGSVGSGKSLLMDLFFAAAGEALSLEHSRRLHFNAALLEIHSRLHHLDARRQQRLAARREGGRQDGAAARAAAGEQRHPQQQGEGPWEAADPATGFSLPQQQGEEQPGGDEDAASDAQVARWFDEGVLRQKEAKAAVLAIRRHLREARAGRVPESRLAAANAPSMLAAARSFIRARGPDPAAGWGAAPKPGDRLAALLCFDEMQVGDVFCAAALKGLFEALAAEGCVVVLTSNRHPADLPRHGLHEAMFGHFLNTLLTSCRLFELSAAADYRRLALEGAAARLLQQPLLQPPAAGQAPAGQAGPGQPQEPRTYFWPLGGAAQLALERKWAQAQALAAGAAHGASKGEGGGGTAVLPVLFGRQLRVRSAGGAAWFDFHELCGRPLGAADYLAVASAFHTVFVSGVPALSMDQRDQARRFITLVDELYNARALLVCSAAAPPDALFAGAGGAEPIIDLEGLQFEGAVEGSRLRTDLLADGGVAPVAATPAAAAAAAAELGGAEERFAFARAVSRLYEMQAPAYEAARPRGGAGGST